MSKIIKIIDYIKAIGAKLTLGSLASYETIPTTADLTDADIPSWSNVNDITVNIPPAPVVLDVIPAGTSIPYFIDTFDYPDFTQHAEIITKLKSEVQEDGSFFYQRRFDMEVDEAINGDGDFIGWNIQLITNGDVVDGHIVSSEDVYIVLKP